MRYRFDGFLLDQANGTLTGPEGPVTLRRQTWRLLEVLLQHAPALVSRDTLLDEAWGRTALSPNVLPQAVSELRHALGDSAANPRIIATLHRRGYKIIPEVEVLEAQPSGPATPGEPAPEASARADASGRKRTAWLAGLGAGISMVAAALWHAEADDRWLEQEVLPQIRLLKEQDVAAAWTLLHRARMRFPDDQRLEQHWLDLSLPVDLNGEPAGATVRVAGYRSGTHSSADSAQDVSADSDESAWVTLGQTPLEGQRLPLAALRFQVTLPGHLPLEAAPSVLPRPEAFSLFTSEAQEPGMVYIPAGPVVHAGESRQLPAFWIDRHEVTNAAFKRFIESGGYDDPQWWPDQIVHQGQILDRGELLARLVDQSGLAGPSPWRLGTYPPGMAEHPVAGISWYEARAYARWAGKTLPTVFHWYRAAGLGTPQAALFSDILTSSHFGGATSVAVIDSGGLGPYGTHGMAGNVREWCLNSAGDRRYALGASWRDNPYQYTDWSALAPLSRESTSGMRLIRQASQITPELAADVPADIEGIPEPIDNASFSHYSRMYAYDDYPLNAREVEIDDSHEVWRREQIEFHAAYGSERVTVQLYIPRTATPPYQSVIHFPGGDARMLGDSREASLIHVEPFLRTGRVVIYPVYQGTFERSSGTVSGPVGLREQIVHQVKDLRRTLDYVESRTDFDPRKIAFHGVSYGASRSVFALAVEDRIHNAMLVSTGLSPLRGLPPELNQSDYLPRIDLPLLLLTGRKDFSFNYERSQRPFFELLGTHPSRKVHRALDWGHLPPGYSEVDRELIAWLDRWFGPATFN